VLLCGGLILLLLVGGELHLPFLVCGRPPVLVGARWPLLQLQKQAGIWLLLVVLLLLLLLRVVLRLAVSVSCCCWYLASTRPQLGV
jgi:hypothetical protein